ncbi:MAG: 4Fe-4S binding protein [Pseudoflavonifractor sp.]|nr:4Fe-4S binding protein [Alloprevotella sp.]MCM1116323.1 4Fe-4S binding protein [Pseudoflavonifractor sp.]
MLRNFRVAAAVAFLCCITLLFLDFSGTAPRLFGWMAKIQFLPALMALNFVALAFVVALTLLLGRVYCSVICPLGVMQDIFGWAGKRAKRNRYTFSKAKTALRWAMLGVMALAIVAGVGSIVALLAPYSAYGRIAQSLLQPIWVWGNNILADMSEMRGDYAFYQVEWWTRSRALVGVAAATLIILAFLAWRNGRTYCNTICPVGTVLGFLARYSWLHPVIDTSKCNGCGLCARNCKASCIDSKAHEIDLSRCVACMDCIDKCHKGAISYTHRPRPAVAAPEGSAPDGGRRSFLTVTAAMGAATMLHARKKVDGGLAVIADKKAPERSVPIVPPGAVSLRHLTDHCTGCQLCVAECPNGVLRPSGELSTLLQPHASYERGYCRPECTRCSDVCPAGAILPIGRDEKSSIQVGHAVWVKENCVAVTDEVECGNCSRHCPAGAIIMVPLDKADPASRKIPAVNEERCIGCGACENLCPSRPFSAIYVEGHQVHRTI